MGRGVKERRLMLLGDSGTGKTSLLRSADCVPPAPDLPAVYFKFLERPPGKRKVLLSLWDAPGNEPVPARDAVFPRLDAAIIVFSLDDPDTLENAKRNWYPQVRSKCGKKIPIILVGNKRDLRDDGSEHGISYEQGLKVAEKIRAYAYVECSNLDEHGPLDAFKFAVKAVVKTSSSCSLMGPCEVCPLENLLDRPLDNEGSCGPKDTIQDWKDDEADWLMPWTEQLEEVV